MQGGEKSICPDCMINLPYTNDQPQQNYLANQLRALQPIDGVYALCYFNRGNLMEHFIHHLKYRKRTDIGEHLGQRLGRKIQQYTFEYDYIIPVPLHPKKELKRGFNQSYCIARGVSNRARIPICKDLLIRKKYTATQTKKSRIQRFENMKNAFEVMNRAEIEGKQIILVDDVITTGSTAITCAEVLLNAGAANVFIAAIAKADLF